MNWQDLFLGQLFKVGNFLIVTGLGNHKESSLTKVEESSRVSTVQHGLNLRVSFNETGKKRTLAQILESRIKHECLSKILGIFLRTLFQNLGEQFRSSDRISANGILRVVAD